ncbi:hypothetical protein K435DRAFT_805975 [Dendrothele bispora CBS 962.96]|uniref:Uncharacterized protein n=1 Tax=Dendrothele bispora (strain CBS 962.96) TaxID=1314807 RepID=A0A4S8LAN1_DENBC|nr:hypothetical protein K435DRAFT_805975 [Dendrothele bispora CBS 962.96]
MDHSTTDIRYDPENVFVVGITPGPGAPSVITISHILQPLVDILNPYWNGVIMQTHRHPAGTLMRVAVLPFIADLQAIQKITGFLGTAANLFCSWCKCPNKDRECLDMHKWLLRSPAEVRQQTTVWRSETTIKGRNQLGTQNSVRWTPLYDLPYFDPVWHVVLGFMHNTLEGILEDHLRQLWRIGGKEKNKVDDPEYVYASPEEEDDDDDDMDTDWDLDLSELKAESEEQRDLVVIFPFRTRCITITVSRPEPRNPYRGARLRVASARKSSLS